MDKSKVARFYYIFVILQRKIRARDWSTSRHVTFTNMQCCPRGQH